jgi:hypothetical protein
MTSSGWSWHRWQLISVVEVGGEVIVDAIELSRDPLKEPGALITLSFVPPNDDGAGASPALGLRLARWRDADEGVCDALFQEGGTAGYIAMFQGDDVLALATAP